MLNLYTKPNCPNCVATKTALQALGVPYNELELTNPDNLTLVKSWGFLAAPVIDNNGDRWSGFRADKLAELA